MVPLRDKVCPFTVQVGLFREAQMKSKQQQFPPESVVITFLGTERAIGLKDGECYLLEAGYPSETLSRTEAVETFLTGWEWCTGPDFGAAWADWLRWLVSAPETTSPNREMNSSAKRRTIRVGLTDDNAALLDRIIRHVSDANGVSEREAQNYAFNRVLRSYFADEQRGVARS